MPESFHLESFFFSQWILFIVGLLRNYFLHFSLFENYFSPFLRTVFARYRILALGDITQLSSGFQNLCWEASHQLNFASAKVINLSGFFPGYFKTFILVFHLTPWHMYPGVNRYGGRGIVCFGVGFCFMFFVFCFFILLRVFKPPWSVTLGLLSLLENA